MLLHDQSPPPKTVEVGTIWSLTSFIDPLMLIQNGHLPPSGVDTVILLLRINPTEFDAFTQSL